MISPGRRVAADPVIRTAEEQPRAVQSARNRAVCARVAHRPIRLHQVHKRGLFDADIKSDAAASQAAYNALYRQVGL